MNSSLLPGQHVDLIEPWLRTAPNDWPVSKIKYLIPRQTRRSESNENSIALDNIEGWTGRFLASETEYTEGGVAFVIGDILFGKLRPYLAKVYLPKAPGQAVGDVFVLRPDEKILPRYACYFLLSESLIHVVSGSTFGAKMPRTSWEFLGGLRVRYPSVEFQKEIVSYIDRKTARIDSLIKKKTRFIELLKEKRQALVTHAVTTGVDPDVPMKDSGVAWIGRVPRHWLISRLRYLSLSISTGPFGTAVGAADYVDNMIPIINPSNISERRCVPDTTVTVSQAKAAELAFWAMREGDVVVARRGELGRAALVTNHEAGWICGTGSLRITPDPMKVDSKYVLVVLHAYYARKWLEFQSVGSTMPNLSEELIGDLPIAVPPTIEEQQNLLQQTIKQEGRIIALVKKTEYSIELMKERRAALITAAVTGKIDVREAANTISTSEPA